MSLKYYFAIYIGKPIITYVGTGKVETIHESLSWIFDDDYDKANLFFLRSSFDSPNI